jgi:hypothetical protein
MGDTDTPPGFDPVPLPGPGEPPRSLLDRLGDLPPLDPPGFDLPPRPTPAVPAPKPVIPVPPPLDPLPRSLALAPPPEPAPLPTPAPEPPPPSLLDLKPADPPASAAAQAIVSELLKEKPAAPPPPAPEPPAASAGPPMPGPLAWVGEAAGVLVRPTRRKLVVATGLASLFAGAGAVKLFWPPPKPSVTARGVMAESDPPAPLPLLKVEPETPKAEPAAPPKVEPVAPAKAESPTAAPPVIGVPAIDLKLTPPSDLPPPGPIELPKPAEPVKPFDMQTAPVVDVPAAPPWLKQAMPDVAVVGIGAGYAYFHGATRPVTAAPPPRPTDKPAPPGEVTLTIPSVGGDGLPVPSLPAGAEVRQAGGDLPLPAVDVPKPAVEAPKAPAAEAKPIDAPKLTPPAIDSIPKPADPPVKLDIPPINVVQAGGPVDPPAAVPAAPKLDIPAPTAPTIPSVTTPTPEVKPAAPPPALPKAEPKPLEMGGPLPKPTETPAAVTPLPAIDVVKPSPVAAEPPKPEPAAPPPTRPAELPIVKAAGTADAKASPAATDYDEDLHAPERGDTYAAVSRRYYGDERYAAALQAYNQSARVADLKLVKVPPIQVLRKGYAAYLGRPAGGEEPAPKPAAAVPAAGGRKTWTVPAGGQTMKQVAAAAFGDENLWGVVFDHNRGLYPDRVIPAGTRLTLPPDARIGE